ncbi:non-ribosomal peptide synthetase [Chryseobacterium sp. LAM-KRS1]|uniref:non-ribosomal peptide synthetase n=1 Tax=Chryseobacterium sp. LAM-KRS1 TaxID=2715754 RepID=UPI0015539984|nr:non-ribosomal peptide synthetase [Chryseobacterium sp. LAM-KRS1]
MLQLLEELKIRNIHLSVKNENLVIDTQDDIEEDLINQIKVHKQEIISYILKHNSNRVRKHTSTSQDHPVSDAQKRMWLQSITEEGSKAYHLKYPLEIPIECNTEILRSVVLRLVNDHEIFRTVFSLSEEGEVRQTVLDRDKNTFDVGIVDFKDKNNGEKLIEEKIDHLNSIAFDLSKGPLLRCIIFELNDKIILYFIFHHIIMDGVSSVLLKHNIFDYYNALSNSEDLHGPTLQYLDYTYWKQSNIDKGNYNNSRDYWLNLLSKNIPVIDLPSSLSRPHTLTFNSYSLKTDISPVLTQKLDAFSKLNQGTLYVGVLSVINILLNKYTSERDITLGTFTSGRNHPDINEMLGLFVNTIVLNNTINPEEDTFSDVFRKTKESFTQAFSHQDYPFDMLVEDLQLTNDAGRSPLFDITVAFQDYMNNDSDNRLLFDDEIKEFGSRHRAFDLNFEVLNRGSFLTLITAFNTDIYEKKIISSFINHFKNLLDALVSSPDVLLSGIDYLGAEEKELLLERFNATEVSYPEEETIVSLFEKQVNNIPDHIALIYEDVKLTYRELNEQSNRLAHYLREQYDIQSDDLIGIQLPRGENMIVSILGILKSGGAYVPISPDYPGERTNYILTDTQAKVNIDETFISEFETLKNNYSIQNPDSVIKSDNLAYVIYTSGTTGNPKGVMIGHKSVVNLISDLYRCYGLNDNDVILQSANYVFDASVEQMFLAILNGNSLLLIKDKMLLDETALLEKISDHHVSYVHLTPSLLQNIDITKADGVRILNSGGESLSSNLYNKLKNGSFLLINSYGPTETTVTSIVNIGNGTNSIGKPVANTHIYILDAYGQLVPVGVSGELYIAGTGLARGYLNLDELTEEKFVTNPFVEGTKMYRTGDLARWLPDGTVEYLGRIDGQVKIRGHRIELGEIDSQVLSYSDAIKNVVTEVMEYDGEKSLVVYYMAEEVIDKQSLSRYLKNKLPQYMLPGFYVELKSIPLTSNGKIDKKSLPAVSTEDLIRNEYVAPSTEIEYLLMNALSQLLNYEIQEVSVHDNFFDMGLNSLSMIRFSQLLRKEAGLEIEIAKFFSYPTISELSEFIQNMNKTTAETNTYEDKDLSDHVDSFIDNFN